MSKNILVISTSLRSNSNSDILADSFIAGGVSDAVEITSHPSLKKAS